MAEYYRYAILNGEDNEELNVLFEQAEYQEAKEYAAKIRGKVLCYEYEVTDSYVVDDFTPSQDDDEEDEGD
jgi:hypothetical protein